MKSESVWGDTDFAPEFSRGEVGYAYDGTPYSFQIAPRSMWRLPKGRLSGL